MPAGRPTKYEDRFCEELIQHMALGFSFESFAGKIEVAEDTLYEWQKVNLDFSEAHRIGKSKMRVFWEELGIVGTTEGKNFNASAWAFNMKNKLRWTDRNDFTSDDQKLEGLVVVKDGSSSQPLAD